MPRDDTKGITAQEFSSSENTPSDNTNDEHRADQPVNIPVIGVGASAGGLESLEVLFSNISPGLGAAFVVVTHMAPDQKSILSQILAKSIALPVSQAKDGQIPEADHVYILAPNNDISLENGCLRVTPRDGTEDIRHPIDFFFRSLAKAMAERAICIILSGTGSDGSLGLKEVKAAGGIVLVQEPEDARYDGMPRSALATGVTDAVLPARDMAVALSGVLNSSMLAMETDEDSLPENSVRLLDQILHRIRMSTGHDFSAYKLSTIVRRVDKRIRIAGCDSFEGYLELLDKTPEELDAVFRDLLIHVTSFFRDKDAFAFVEKDVIPALFRNKSPNEPVRVWVAGASTGEEAYSIALLIREYMDKTGAEGPVQIFATDVDKNAIELARGGQYSASIAADIPEERLRAWFQFHNGMYVVKPILREMVIFARHDMLEDPPFSKLDLICCRNVLIYLKIKAQQRLLSLFYTSLLPQGVLFLGPAESTGQNELLYVPVNKKWKIFRRNENARRPPVAVSMQPRWLSPMAERIDRVVRPQNDPGRLLERHLVKAYAPSAVIIDEHMDVLSYSGDTQEYLVDPEGEPTTNIIKKARRALKARLHNTIKEVMSTDQGSRFSVLRPSCQAKSGVTVIVTSLAVKPPSRRLFSVVFEPMSMASEKDDSKREEGQKECVQDMNAVVLELEEELVLAGEQLQNTVEELEAANEELKSSNEELMSMNEELQSSNEELETSKEELQALNEELITVNAEMGNKVDELQVANEDIENLLRSTNMATVFVDRHMVIRRFTPAAASVFHFIATDVGRPLSDIVSTVDFPEIVQACQNILGGAASKEFELEAKDATFFAARFFPYQTLNGSVEGVVLTFVDITLLKLAEHRLETERFLLDRAVQATGLGILEHAIPYETGHLNISAQWCAILGIEQENIPSVEEYAAWFTELIHPDDMSKVEHAMAQFVAADVETIHLVIRLRHASGEWIFVQWFAYALKRDSDRRPTQVVETLMDITEIKSIEAELRKHKTNLELLVRERTQDVCEREELLSSVLRNYAGGSVNVLDRDLRYVFTDGLELNRLGMNRDEIIGKTHEEVFGKALSDFILPYYMRAFAGETVECEAEYADSVYLWTASPFLVGTSETIDRIVVVSKNITEIKEKERQLEEARQHVFNILEMTTDAFFEVDRDFNFLYINEKGRKVFHITGEDVRGRNMWELFPEAEHSIFHEHYNRALRDQVVVEFEAYFEPFKTWYEFHLYPTSKSLSVYFRVIDDRKEVERTLRDAKEKAEAANRAKTEFLANMSHEIRTPLSGMLGMLQVLGLSELDKRQKELVQVATSSGKTLIHIINDILDLSRVEAGRLIVEEEPTDIRSIVTDVMKLFQVQATEGGNDIQADIDSSVPAEVQCGSTPLRQILFNLVGNAVKFTHNGKVVIRARLAPGDRPHQAALHLSVADTGIGIPQDKLETVFEPFAQVDGSQRRSFSGSGLGLSIVKRFSERMGGSVHIESVEDVGTTVSVVIPVGIGHPEKAGATAQPTGEVGEQRQRVSILLADDDEVGRFAVGRLLEEMGYAVYVASDGIEALDVLRRQKVDLVLMDIQMPEMDGIEATKRIRHDQEFEHIRQLPILALTAFAMSGDKEKILAAGLDDYLAKPVELEDLIAAMERALRGRRRQILPR
ncbi:chemotaxis protein CheB [Desulfovibrio inopinatus]|uniref:chemotaxis protein CheB n=1 Tax=Desulfovibrio inopinatus TaxID=102109 RepID=UPI000406E15B|nr:chemotaxis protein CheB [Desulfovibrio inopinatus]